MIRMYLTYLLPHWRNPNHPVKGSLPFVQRMSAAADSLCGVPIHFDSFQSPVLIEQVQLTHSIPAVIQHETPRGAHILRSLSLSLDPIWKYLFCMPENGSKTMVRNGSRSEQVCVSIILGILKGHSDNFTSQGRGLFKHFHHYDR